MLAGTSFKFFPGGGTILTNFLGGAKYEKNKILCAKTQKGHYFSNSGGANATPPCRPHPNDVPG